MTPHFSDDWLTVYGGDAREVLPDLASNSVDCIVTSPPYWGLRDYGTDGQLGLEATPEEYVANLVAVFREVKRVLRDDGTLWLNLGDSYSSGSRTTQVRDSLHDAASGKQANLNGIAVRPASVEGLGQKQLVGIPWRVAFALQADGWYLRSDIIWAKPNPMPESVTDRPTKAHEYLFLLSKSPRYYFDQEAVREPSLPQSIERMKSGWNGNEYRDHPNGGHDNISKYIGTERGMANAIAGRNLRSVWTIATRPYPGAHFAVFPPELPERCIKAGSSERGVCPECGAPWERVVERGEVRSVGGSATGARAKNMATVSPLGQNPEKSAYNTGVFVEREHLTTGWRPTCACERGMQASSTREETVPATILDPFAGSGTVGVVANRLSRRAILIDLKPEYLEQQMQRNAQVPAGL